MSKPLLLLIAYYFPPDHAIGGARPFRFYKYLKQLGYECHVLTAAGTDGKGIASDVECLPDPLRLRPQSGMAWQAERFTWKLLHRGMHALGWSQAVVEAGRRFLTAHASDRVVILSTAPPTGTHLAAWRLARKFGRPWIADFRDPIFSPAASHRAPFETMAAPLVERRILKKATAILANTDSMRDAWVSGMPSLEPKIHVIWNGFDAEDKIEPQVLPVRDRKIWSHVGELYGGRDIRPILSGVNRLLTQGRWQASQIQIRQVGEIEPQCLPEGSLVEEAKNLGWLELREPVDSVEARRLALESDGLLLIQPQTAVQVPGKLFEYLRLGRPILAYVVRNSPVERILQQAEASCECFYPESTPQEIDSKLEAFWNRMRREPYAPNAWFQSTFEASRQAAALDGILQSADLQSVGILS